MSQHRTPAMAISADHLHPGDIMPFCAGVARPAQFFSFDVQAGRAASAWQTGRKQFFFEKKNQKTFVFLACAAG